MSALPSETVFDSPLQEAIALLTALGAHMEARRLQREADTLRRALHLLHSPELNNSKSLKELISAGEMQVDQQLVDWLVQMEWLPKSQEDGEAGSSAGIEGAPASAALRAPASKPGASGTAPPLLPPPPEDETMRASAFISRDSSDSLVGGAGSGGASATPRSQPLFAPCVARSLLPENEKEVLSLLEEGIDEWEFDALRLHELTDGHSLAALGWALFHRHSIHVALGMSDTVLHAFLERIEAGYKAVPYHNAAHAACVAHGVYWLLTRASPEAMHGVAEAPLEMFAALLSATVHDVGHDGRNNAFHSATGSELALLYSDQSVLEMHHLARAFAVLAAPESDVLGALTLEARKDVRARVIGMVLATDLSHNFTLINSFKTMIAEHVAEQATKAQAARAQERPASRSLGHAMGHGDHSVSPAHGNYRRSSKVEPAPPPGKDHGGDGALKDEAAPPVPHRPRKFSARGVSAIFGSAATTISTTAALTGSSSSSLTSDAAASGGEAPLEKRQSFSGNPPPTAPDVAAMSAAEKLLVLKMVIKCADIGNVTKGKGICLNWTERVVMEFFEQGDAEKALGLPVTPMMDRTRASVPKQQIGFYNFVVKPMYEAMAMLVPLDRQFENLEAAAAHWRGKLPTEEEAPGAMAPPAPPKVNLQRQLSNRLDSTPPASPKPSR